MGIQQISSKHSYLAIDAIGPNGDRIQLFRGNLLFGIHQQLHHPLDEIKQIISILFLTFNDGFFIVFPFLSHLLQVL